jgi:uncharacterized protein YaiI (UPF0178 family)
MFKILVDADSSPVKQEVYRVAQRYKLKVILVANLALDIPAADWIEVRVVGKYLDAADDWIVEHIEKDDIVITGDIPLASRSLQKGARGLSPQGFVFTENSIGNAMATRDLMTHLRDIGIATVGPPTFNKKYRSRFLQALDGLIQATLNRK